MCDHSWENKIIVLSKFSPNAEHSVCEPLRLVGGAASPGGMARQFRIVLHRPARMERSQNMVATSAPSTRPSNTLVDPTWLGQTLASILWVASVFAYDITEAGDWLQLFAALVWFVDNVSTACKKKG